MRAEQLLTKRLASRTIHDLYGNQILNKKKDLENYKTHVTLTDRYYSKEMNSFFGISQLAALFESLSSTTLWWLLPGPATTVNAFATLGEFAQVQVARTNLFGERDKKEARIRADGAMAWLQILAGCGGLTSSITGAINPESKETSDLSLIQKATLSLSCLISSMFLFFGNGEKSVMATTTQKNGHSKESVNIRINGNSDGIFAVEAFAMSLVPWFSKFKTFKTILDYAVTYGAFREGISHFIDNGISKVFNNDVIPVNGKFKQILKNIFLVPSNRNTNGTISWPFKKKWFLGSDSDLSSKGLLEAGSHGFRNKYLLPVLRFFGCNPPVCYLDQDENIVSEYYETTTTQNRQNFIDNTKDNEMNKPELAISSNSTYQRQSLKVHAISSV